MCKQLGITVQTYCLWRQKYGGMAPRECLALEVGRSFTACDVTPTLQYPFAVRGAPEYVRSDNGPQFIAKQLQRWLDQATVGTLYIQKGSPWDKGYVESFNGKLRDARRASRCVPTQKMSARNPPRGRAGQSPSRVSKRIRPPIQSAPFEVPGLLLRRLLEQAVHVGPVTYRSLVAEPPRRGSYRVGTTFAGTGLAPVGTLRLSAAHRSRYKHYHREAAR